MTVDKGFIRLERRLQPGVSTSDRWTISCDGNTFRVTLRNTSRPFYWLVVSNLRNDDPLTYDEDDAYFCPYEGNFWVFNGRRWTFLEVDLSIRLAIQAQLVEMGYHCEGEVAPPR